MCSRRLFHNASMVSHFIGKHGLSVGLQLLSRTGQDVIMDSIVTAVIAKFKIRSEFGKSKYGTDLDRTDLSVLDWIAHAQEEHMDAILYLEKLKQTLSGRK